MKRLLLLALLFACGGGAGKGPAGATSAPSTPGGDQVKERVVVEKQPDGSIKRTTIRTTKHVVPAPVPAARPADPYPADPLVRHNVERINAYRAEKGLAPLLHDTKISAFAVRGSEQLAKDQVPHAHFAANARGAPGFGSSAAENQGDPRGVPALDADRGRSGVKQVDLMLKLMIDEGPGGGHHDNMMNTRFRRVGIGLVQSEGKLFMTNDFSD